MIRGLLERDVNLIIIAVFSEINAHTFKAISSKQRNERRILFFELVSDVFEGFSHCVFNHFFFGLLDFFKSPIEVIKDLTNKGRSLALKFLPHSSNPLLIKGNWVHQELHHVAKLDKSLLFRYFGFFWEARILHFWDLFIWALLNRVNIFLDRSSFF